MGTAWALEHRTLGGAQLALGIQKWMDYSSTGLGNTEGVGQRGRHNECDLDLLSVSCFQDI